MRNLRNRHQQPDPASSDAPKRLKAIDKIAYYLGARDHSEHELRQKLKRRYTEEEIDAALAEADARRWLMPPEQLAQKTILRLQRNKKSAAYIAAQLRKLRLPPATIDAQADLEIACQLLRRKYGSGKLSWDDKQQAGRYLQYRGFKPQIIRQAIKDFHVSE